LRARHLADAFRRLGHDVHQAPLPGSKPFFLDLPLTGLMALPAIFFRRFDIAVVIKPYPTLLWPLLLSRRFRGGRIVVDVDDVDFSFRKGPGSRILAALQRPLPALCDLVTTHNDTLQAHIESFHRVPSSRIYRLDQGVALNIYRPLDTVARATLRADAERRTGWGKGPILLYAGHLNVASELDCILDLLPGILREAPEARLVVAGGGPLLKTFRDLARVKTPSGTVHFTGLQTPEQINHWLNTADLALVYYRATESNRSRVSMKIRECLAAGIPVVANTFGDLAQFRDVVRPCETDPAAFANAILDAIAHPPDRETLAVRGRRRIETDWNWDSIARSFVLRLQSPGSTGPLGIAEAEGKHGTDQ
jgi:glycosyltransferase involved in cell wall biosynthesis